MKITNKYAIVLYVAFVLVSAANGQDASSTGRKTIRFAGIVAGYNYSTVAGTLVEKDRPFNATSHLSGKQENGSGFLVYGAVQQQFTKYLYLKYGLGYIQKQVDPEENSYELYKDKLKTGYVLLPILPGLDVPLTRQIGIDLEGGPAVNFKIIDKSTTGPDRVDFKTEPVVISACIGAGISYRANEKIRLSLNYQYTSDLTVDYVEYLYWNNAEPRKPFNYKYRTNVVSIGIGF